MTTSRAQVGAAVDSDKPTSPSGLFPGSVPEMKADVAVSARSIINVAKKAEHRTGTQTMTETAGPTGFEGTEPWSRVRLRLRAELGEEVYSSWFARVELERFDGGSVLLSVPTRFLKQWISSHYRDKLIQLWQQENKAVRRVELSVRGAMRPKPANGNQPLGTAATPKSIGQRTDAAIRQAMPVTPVPAVPSLPDDGLKGSPLDPRLTFDNFVEGLSNNLALAAARKVAASSSDNPLAFNPLTRQWQSMSNLFVFS